MKLTEKHCVPCEGDVPKFTHAQIETYLKDLDKSWRVADGVKIRREFLFKDFKAAMEFVNKVAALANEEDHHPDIHVFYNRVMIELWTHAIGGLSENDFIMASKIDVL